MGLDCTAYSHLELAPTQCASPDERRTHDYCYDHGHIRLYFNESFPHATRDIEGLDDACLVTTDESETFGWRAGSYIGYGIWRSTIANYSMGVDTYGYGGRDSAWDHVDRNEGAPFWELVNFSNCEGTMGPETCKKLHRDFVQHREDYVAYDNQYSARDKARFVHLYDEWTNAFDLARRDGVVLFH